MSICLSIKKDLDFLGPGYKLYFEFLKYAIFIMAVIFSGIGVLDCYINYTGHDISPSYYKYISFITDSPTKTSPVYDHTNQITSILDENSYPYTFIGETSSWVPHVCLPITPSMNESDIYDVISSL